MTDLNLTAEIRSEFGKGAARRLRRAKQIPAVIYGHGAAPLHIVLPERSTMRAIRASNALLTVTVDGAEHLALVKDIQRDPVLQIVEHIDLLTVKKGEKVIVDVPVHLLGEPAPAVVINQEEMTISLSADATNVPVRIDVDITGREVGQHIYATDLILPENAELALDVVMLMVHFAEPTVEAEPEVAE